MSVKPPDFRIPADRALPWHDDLVEIDPTHVYGLDELIDIAQSRNKQTRVAWEQARQAAIGVGISRAAYLPELSVSALGGYQHSALPFPARFVPQGYIISNSEGIFPQLAVKYLLLDFGSRAASVDAAKQASFGANVSFTAAHQALIYDVARSYFTLDGLNAQLRSSTRSLANAHVLQASAEAMYAHGVGNIQDVASARRGVAQATYDMAQATNAEHSAVYGLLQVLALPPTTRLRVADSFARPLPRTTARTVDQLMQDALRQRPDLLVDLAKLRGAEAGVAQARAEFRPTLSLSANVRGNIGGISTNGGPNQGIMQPESTVLLDFSWPLYQGGLRTNKLHLAESKRSEAEDSLQQASETALRDTALAFDQLETGLMQYDSAVALLAASQVAFDAASDAYSRGVGTFVEASNAQTALAAAQASLAKSHSQSLVNAAGLAFTTGALTSSAAPVLASSPGP